MSLVSKDGKRAPLVSDNHFALTRRIVLIFVLLTLVSSIVIGWHAGDISKTTLGYAINWGRMQAGWDSWRAMLEAIGHLREKPTLLYEDIFFGQGVKFQYPLSSLLLLDVPERVTGLGWYLLIRITNFICFISVLAIAIATCFIFINEMVIVNAQGEFHLDARQRLFLIFISLIVVTVFYPVTKSFSLGQIQTLITLAVCIIFLAWQGKRFVSAGILVGICCAIKPQWVVLILWGALRKQWGFVLAATLTSSAIFIAAISMYGVGNFLDYFSVLSFLGRHGESYYPNQSVNGLLHRLFFNGENLEWQANVFPPYHPIVHWMTLASSAFILATAMLWRRNKTPGTLDLALIILSLTMASPIAWDHHYGVLLPILAVSLPAVLVLRAFGTWTAAYVWIAVFLVSQKLDELTKWSASTWLNPLQSYLFFGSLMILLMIYRTSVLDHLASYATARNPLNTRRQANFPESI